MSGDTKNAFRDAIRMHIGVLHLGDYDIITHYYNMVLKSTYTAVIYFSYDNGNVSSNTQAGLARQ